MGQRYVRGEIPEIRDVYQRLQRMSEGELDARVAKIIEESTPLPGNICLECNGQVTKRVVGYHPSSGRFDYSTPTCEVCGKDYFFANEKGVPITGKKRIS